MNSAAVEYRYYQNHTDLKSILTEHYLTFEAVCSSEGRGQLPGVVARTFDAFFNCGEISKGFALVSCKDCKNFDTCGFSCKKRGFCPRCASRRGTSHTIHLMDYIFPKVPVRQWVVTFPPQIRYLMAIRREVPGIVHRITEHEISLSYQRRARKAGLTKTTSGSVSFMHMTGSGLNLAPHFHILFMLNGHRCIKRLLVTN